MHMTHISQSVFQVLVVYYRHPRRYPVFKVYWLQLHVASSLSLAEGFLRTYARDPRNREDVYAFYIREVPVDVPAPGVHCLSERVYGPDGQLIDFRDFSSVDEAPGVFEGRSPERCNKQTYFRHFFVKLIRHFAYCFRGSRALVYS